VATLNGIVPGSSGSPAISSSNDLSTGFYFPSSGNISIAGNLGIGTSSPSSKLHVAGTITANSGNFSQNLQVNNVNISVSGHSHTVSDITNFNSSVSGLLPITNIIAGSGINLAISGTTVTITSNDTRWDLFLPPAPTSVTVAVGSGQLFVSWTAPTVLSQTPITDYTVQYSSNSGSTWTTVTRSASTATSATVSSLTNGTAYVFRVRAINGVGSGSYSATSSAATPLASVTPNAVSGLLMWLDASDASTLYDATSGGSLVSANGAIARWEDKSGNARHALQSSSSQRPLRKSGIIGGKDVVRFDGSNDILNLNNTVRWWPTGTLIAVLGNVTAATGPYWYAVQTVSPTDNPEIRLYPQTGGGLWYWSGDYRNPTGSTAVFGSGSVSTIVISGTSYSSYANSALNSTATFASPITANNPNAYHNLGGYGATSQYLGVDVAELIMYDSALSDATRAGVEGYLKLKWGIT
jgi:hypothetical protein